MPGEHISKQNAEKLGAAAAKLPLFSGLFDVGQGRFGHAIIDELRTSGG